MYYPLHCLTCIFLIGRHSPLMFLLNPMSHSQSSLVQGQFSLVIGIYIVYYVYFCVLIVTCCQSLASYIFEFPSKDAPISCEVSGWPILIVRVIATWIIKSLTFLNHNILQWNHHNNTLECGFRYIFLHMQCLGVLDAINYECIILEHQTRDIEGDIHRQFMECLSFIPSV